MRLNVQSDRRWKVVFLLIGAVLLVWSDVLSAHGPPTITFLIPPLVVDVY